MKNRYKWYRAGDVNAFFGLMLDNIAGMVLMVTLLAAVFNFPVDFALMYMIPGTAIGVLVGDLLYFWLAFRLARKEGRSDVTAMPLGLDTPSTFGMVFLVLGPAFSIKMDQLAENAGWALGELRKQAEAGVEGPGQILEQMNFEAATFAWHIGICSIFISGLIKFGLSFGCNWLRSSFPRAGLLGSLAAIALVLIAFSPLERIAANPLVGFTALIVVFITLVGRNELPFKLPGALASVLVGCAFWYLLVGIDAAGLDILPDSEGSGEPVNLGLQTQWLTVFKFGWFAQFSDSLAYLPYIIPFAFATVIGGIDCAESAASCGDNFDTNQVIRVEAMSTLVASLCGGVIQSTPYIGHPAYKAMGGRAAYVLATALFVGGAGLFGYFGLINRYIPEAALLPILVFIGIEITAQSFHVTPKRHFAALAVACLPAIAKLIVLQVGQYAPEKMATEPSLLVLKLLAGGFIVTSLLWASAMAKIIDRRFTSASIYFAVAGILVLFGVIHSPNDDKLFLPWDIVDFEANVQQKIIEFSVAYLAMAVILFGLGTWMRDKVKPIDTDEQFEKIAY